LALFEFADHNEGIQAKIHGSLQQQHNTDTVAMLKQEIGML
jgi:hypothetical protein